MGNPQDAEESAADIWDSLFMTCPCSRCQFSLLVVQYSELSKRIPISAYPCALTTLLSILVLSPHYPLMSLKFKGEKSVKKKKRLRHDDDGEHNSGEGSSTGLTWRSRYGKNVEGGTRYCT